MAELDNEESVVLLEERRSAVEASWDDRIWPVAGGEDDDDDDDYQGDDGHDDTGEDDHDLSNQDPDSDD